MTYDQYTYTVENPSTIRSIVLTDADVPVEVLSSGNGSMHATYYESDKEWYDIEVDGDTLYIKKKIRIMVGLFMFRKDPEHVKLTMYVPVGYSGTLSIATSDGDVRVTGVSASDMTVKTSDGDIDISRAHINGSVTCKAVDGDIKVGSITAQDASVKTTDGKIVLDRPLVSGKLSCRTTDGSIKGVLAGRASDYALSVRTVDGRSNIASGGTGPTVCEIKATDGNIKISFEDGDQ